MPTYSQLPRTPILRSPLANVTVLSLNLLSDHFLLSVTTSFTLCRTKSHSCSCSSGFRPWFEKADGAQRASSAPVSWPKTILLALAAVAVLVLGSEFVIQPLASHFWHTPENVSSLLKTPVHEWKSALRNLAIVWLFAGFGEEIGYRGYLLTRAADLGNRSNLAYILACYTSRCSSALGTFTKVQPVLWTRPIPAWSSGSVYLLSGRNLWAPITGARLGRYCRRSGDLHGMGHVKP